MSTEPNYEIVDLMKYKNTSLKDVTSIQEILNLLPYSKYQAGMIVRINSNPSELQIDYKTLAVDTRSEIENQVGRKLSDYASNMELWKSEILFKETIVDERTRRDEIYKTILADIFSERDSGDSNMLIIDSESFANQKVLELSDVDRQEILEAASEYVSIVYDMSKDEYDKLHSNELMIGLSEIRNRVNRIEIKKESGDLKNALVDSDIDESGNKNNSKKFVSGNQVTNSMHENFIEEIVEGKYICTIFILENGKKEEREYEVYFENEKWNVEKI